MHGQGCHRADLARLVTPSPSVHPLGSGLGLLGLPWAEGEGMARLPLQLPDNLGRRLRPSSSPRSPPEALIIRFRHEVLLTLT
jgi:hypothetical protein